MMQHQKKTRASFYMLYTLLWKLYARTNCIVKPLIATFTVVKIKYIILPCKREYGNKRKRKLVECLATTLFECARIREKRSYISVQWPQDLRAWWCRWIRLPYYRKMWFLKSPPFVSNKCLRVRFPAEHAASQSTRSIEEIHPKHQGSEWQPNMRSDNEHYGFWLAHCGNEQQVFELNGFLFLCLFINCKNLL